MPKAKRATRPSSTDLTAAQVKEIKEKASAGIRLKDLMAQYRIGSAKLYGIIGTKSATPKKASAASKSADKTALVFRETFGGASASPHQARMQLARLQTNKLVDLSKDMQRQRVMSSVPSASVDYAAEHHRLREIVIDQSHQLCDLRFENKALRRTVASLNDKQVAGV